MADTTIVFGGPAGSVVPIKAVATQAAIRAAIGAVGDAAWSGTGNGTVIALLKAIATNTTPIVP